MFLFGSGRVAKKVKRAWHLTYTPYPFLAFEKLRRAIIFGKFQSGDIPIFQKVIGNHNNCQNWPSNVDSFQFLDHIVTLKLPCPACNLKLGRARVCHLFPPPLHYIMSLRSSCNWWKLHKSPDICFSQVAICQNWASNVDSFQFLDHIVTLKLPGIII